MPSVRFHLKPFRYVTFSAVIWEHGLMKWLSHPAGHCLRSGFVAYTKEVTAKASYWDNCSVVRAPPRAWTLTADPALSSNWTRGRLRCLPVWVIIWSLKGEEKEVIKYRISLLSSLTDGSSGLPASWGLSRKRMEAQLMFRSSQKLLGSCEEKRWLAERGGGCLP